MQEILSKPQCSNCGFQIERDCVAGAGCPACGRRLWPEPSASAAAAGPAAADFVVLQKELDRLAADNKNLASENERLRKTLEDEGDDSKPKRAGRKSKGEADGGA